MSIRITHRTSENEAGQRLDEVTGAWLRHALARPLSKSAIRRLIMSGIVRVNGCPAPRPGMRLLPAARLDAVIDARRLPPATPATRPVIDVLFEDEALIAVSKPPDLAVHATADPSRPDLFTLVREHLAGGGAGAAPESLPYLGLHHRLDRDTSGVVLFTKSREANAGLARQFEQHLVEKVYHALAAKPARSQRGSWRVSNHLAQVGKGSASRVRSVENGGLHAETRFTLLEELESALLVEARPVTGRKHQIRAHLAERTPILGDVRYGGPPRAAGIDVPRTMLHARSLALRHPLHDAVLRIECAYPADFRAVLEALRG